MKKTKFLCSILLASIIAMAVLLARQQTANAQDCRIIRIQGMVTHGSIHVEPKTLWISKGTCVIWFNRSSTEEVKVIFEDGKRCSSVSDAPVGFSLDHESCYVTSWISFGGTSSLRFMEAGTYEYVIEAKGMEGVKIRGQLVVEE